jgi:hypothetical protein
MLEAVHQLSEPHCIMRRPSIKGCVASSLFSVRREVDKSTIHIHLNQSARSGLRIASALASAVTVITVITVERSGRRDLAVVPNVEWG